MIELANGLDRLLQLLIIAQPAANLANPFATHAELSGTGTGIAHGQHENPMAFATRAFRAVLGVPDNALQQRAPQHLAPYRELVQKRLARTKRPLPNHSS